MWNGHLFYYYRCFGFVAVLLFMATATMAHAAASCPTAFPNCKMTTATSKGKFTFTGVPDGYPAGDAICNAEFTGYRFARDPRFVSTFRDRTAGYNADDYAWVTWSGGTLYGLYGYGPLDPALDSFTVQVKNDCLGWTSNDMPATAFSSPLPGGLDAWWVDFFKNAFGASYPPRSYSVLPSGAVLGQNCNVARRLWCCNF